jgi:methionyl-tRNA synthetase
MQGTGSTNFNPPGLNSRKKYITTAISYTNGAPHIGHAYEFITADVLARYFRLFGYETFFLTGADEHGQKVAASAQKAGKSPIDHCNYFVEQFQRLDSLLNISYDRYIRTTDADHMATAQKLWLMCNHDIYLDKYVGWYNEREECFVTDAEAELSGYKDSGSGLPLKKVEEESYFFKMSSFCEDLMAHIEHNPQFIQPEQFRNHICIRLKAEGLKDLSISRTSFSWGIPVPNDEQHVMYVWFDALTNYLSGVKALDTYELSSFWPASFHIIGKDIVWFHCVIWPCMLMSAKLPLPGKLLITFYRVI